MAWSVMMSQTHADTNMTAPSVTCAMSKKTIPSTNNGMHVVIAEMIEKLHFFVRK